MWNATIKGLLSHKLRLALTALAIVLGVSFVSGTYVLTDTMNATFSQLFKDTTKGIDVVVQTKQTFASDQGDTRDPVPASLLQQIKSVDGVKVAEGSVNGFAQFIGKNGKAVTTGGAPTLGVSASEAPELNSNFTMRSGRIPAGPNEVAVDAQTASKQGFKVGDQVKVLSQGPTRTYTVSGIVGFGQADNLAGATLAVFDLKTAQQVLDSEGKFNEIDVVAQPGVTPEQLRDRIAGAVPSKYESITGADQAQRSAKEIQDGLGFFSTALLAFAGVALFVGAFLIFNTFSIIVAQRTRELALLRCLGASRRQVLGSVFELRTVIVSMVVGVVITLVSSFMPALRATRVPPVAAMRAEAATPPSRSIRRRSIIGSLVTLIGVGLLLLGLFRDVDNRISFVGAGAVVIFLGVAILSPLIARPLARWIGWPFAKAFRLPGNLARQNAMRNPRRTSATAAALMIGLALVTFAGIFVASAKASFGNVLDRTVSADYIATTQNFQGFSPDVAKHLAALPDLQAVTASRYGGWRLHGQSLGLQAVDPAAYDSMVRTETTSGSLADLQNGGLAVSEDVAKQRGWKVGTVVPMEFPADGVQQVPLKAIYKDNELNGGYLLSLADYQKGYGTQLDSMVIAKVKPGVDAASVRGAIDKVVADFPNVQVQDMVQYKQQVGKQLDQLLNLVRILLAFAIVIALFGAILGMAVGVFFGWTMVRALASQGFGEFSVPGGQLVAYVLLAAVAGVLAAILPGRRAAKVDMLRAITTE